ncbi:hypothetical protein M9X92_012081 [Pyricularia oryzae]|nr:hypothetical protein M9X92_012081 [Pyricularia oryzae]
MSQPDGLQQNLLPATLPSARRGPTNSELHSSKPVANLSDAVVKDDRPLDNAAEAPASVDTASKTSQRNAAPKRKRKAPYQLPLDSKRNMMGSKSASHLEDTTVDTQALEMKQVPQVWEVILAKITSQQLDFRHNLMAKLQLLRQEEREKALLRLAYEGVKQQLQKKALEVIELQKKLDAKESAQTVKTTASRDQGMLPLNSNVQTVTRSSSTVEGCEVGHRGNMQANAATQPHSQNGMRNSESSYPQQTAAGGNRNKTFRFINVR